MITPTDLERLLPSCRSYYGSGGRYGEEGRWYPAVLPRLFSDPDYYKLPTRLADLRPGERAVDILCGNCIPGALTVALARSQPQASIIGLDPSHQLLDTCRENVKSMGLSNAQWVLSDDEKLELEPQSVDVVVNRLGVHHIRDFSRTMSMYRRVLRPRGRVIMLDFTVPDDDDDAEHYINTIYRSRDTTHVKIRSAKEVTDALADAGFRTTEIVPWKIVHLTDEFGYPDPAAKRRYITAFLDGSSHAREIHHVATRGEELTFTHPAFVLAAQAI